MKTIVVGRHYRRVADQKCFRVFAVLPEEDFAVIARTHCTSTRLRRASLSGLCASLAANKIIPVEVDEPSFTPREARSDAANAVFDKISPAIQKLLAPGITALSVQPMWPAIVSAATEVGVPPQTLNLAFTRVLLAGGIIDAAVPSWHKCGRKPSSGKLDHVSRPTNQPDSYPLFGPDYTNIAAGVRKFLRNDSTWQEAHDKFLAEYYPGSEKIVGDVRIIKPLPEGQRPSLYQFKWHGMKLVPLQERLEQQIGERRTQTEHRGRPYGQSAPALYPGQVYEIDWTLSDIVGVARGNRLSIGRFVFYATADVHCGLITSAYLTMFGGTAHQAGKAIVQCVEDKVALCASVGLTITKDMWDTQALPVELRSDRGEIDSWKSTGLGTALGMKLEYCPGKRPDLKGTIESFFRVVRYYLRRLRGGTSGHRERLKDHPNVTAIYDFQQVQKLLYTLAIAFNRRVRRRQAMTPGMIAAHTLPVPNEMYRWAKERGCIREFSLDAARIGALPTHFGSVTMEGIKIKGLRFHVPEFEPSTCEGIDPNDWLMRARKGSWRVEIGIDPSTVNFVWLRHRKADGSVIALQCNLSEEHAGWRDFSWLEYGHNKEEYRVALKNYAENQLGETRAWVRGVLTQTSTEAITMTTPARAGMTASKQIAGAKERRETEMNDVPDNGPTVGPNALEDFFDDAAWGKN